MSELYGRFQALTAESNKVKKSYEKVSKICSIYITVDYLVSIDKLYGGCNYICFDSFRFFTVRVFSSQMSLMSIFSMIFYCTEEILCFMYPQHRLHWCF